MIVTSDFRVEVVNEFVLAKYVRKKGMFGCLETEVSVGVANQSNLNDHCGGFLGIDHGSDGNYKENTIRTGHWMKNKTN